VELGSNGGGFTCKSRRPSGKISCRLKVGSAVSITLIILSPPPFFVCILFNLPTGGPGAIVIGTAVPGALVIGAAVPGGNVAGALVFNNIAHNPFTQKVHPSAAPEQSASKRHCTLHLRAPEVNGVGASVPGADVIGSPVPGNDVIGFCVPFTGVNVIGAKVAGATVPITGTNVVGGGVVGSTVTLTGAVVVGSTVADEGTAEVGARVVGKRGGLVATGGRVVGELVANKLVGDGVEGGAG